MKKKLILLAACVFCWNCAHAQKQNYQVIAIAFYNLENFFDIKHNPEKNDEDFTPDGTYHYTRDIYKQKLHNIATVLQKLGTDVTPDGPAIIGHAEVENDTVLSDLVSQPEIRSRHYRFVWFKGPDVRGITCALIYNPKYFQVLHAEPVPVDLSSTTDKSITRDVLHVYGILAGDTVHVLVNHWPSRYGGEAISAPKRKIAASVNKRITDSLLRIYPKTKIIVMGDLNDDPVDISISKVLGAKGNKEEVTTADLYNPWVNFYKKGLGTLGYNDSWDLFDQIMVSGDFLLTNSNDWHFYKAEVFNKDFLIEKHGQYKGYPKRSFSGTNWNNGFSDHFPTIIYLTREVSK